MTVGRVDCLSTLPSISMQDMSTQSLLSIASIYPNSVTDEWRYVRPSKVPNPQEAVRNLPGVQRVHELLGQGSCSYVYSCSLEGIKQRLAVKLLTRCDQPLSENREALVLMQAQHPNLVRLMFLIEGPPHALAFEMCSGGTLQECLHGARGGPAILSKVDTRARLRAALDIAFAIQYLHDLDIIHRDVKSGNSFLTKPLEPDPVQFPTIKLGDLGFARSLVTPSSADMMTKCIGTVRYMAPEVISSGIYNLAADIFSFGVLVNELLSGVFPYSTLSCNNGALAIAIMQGQRPSLDFLNHSFSDRVLRRLLQDCYDPLPGNRPWISEVVERLAVQVGVLATAR